MFKRLLVLAVAIAVFVTVFFVYFHVTDAQIENGFRQEREKFHVQGIPLTSDNPPALTPEAASAEPATPASSTAVPAPTISNPSDASTNAPVNPDTLIGPVPPSSDTTTPGAATPDDATPSATPATPTTSPTAPSATPVPAVPASTLLYPGLNRLPLVVLAAYNSQGLRVQTPVATPSAETVTAPAPAPAIETNAATSSPANTETAAPRPAIQPEFETNRAPAATTSTVSTPATPPHSPVPVAASVIVLGYHQFTGPGVPSKNIYSMRQDVFEQEMKYLKDNNYHVVPLSDVVRFIKHEIGLQPNSVAVTIDDGYKSAIVWAAPVLKKYNYPWTFFVYPDFITVAEGKGAASWNDLLQLQSEGVDVECHSKSHPILTKKGGKTPEQYDAWLTAETAGAKATIEQHLGKPIKYFAYPYGAYNKEVEAKVIAAGFEAIFTVANNPVHPSTNIDAVGRYIITAPVEKAFASYLRQGALGVADASPAPGATINDPRPVISAVIGYAGNLDPKTISTEVRDFGEVRHDFDPKTSTVRLYLPRDLIDSVVVVNIRAKDAGQTMIASWRFNYAPAAPTAVSTNAPAPATVAVPSATTNEAPLSGTNAPSLSAAKK
jgi:peptidoglycan/xylan/chitin deacetylase (PgdA/CDA1 family)